MTRYGPTILFIVLTVFTTASHVRSQGAVLPKIAGSTILADLQNLKNSNPNITPRELVQRGNEMMPQKGITYVFDVCDFLAQNGKRLREVENEFFQPYSVRLTTVDGQAREFEMAISDPFEGTGCFTKVAALRVTPTEMTVVADGKPVTLLRPKGFRLQKTDLVDNSLKKVLRRWEAPFQFPPVGISADGLKLHTVAGLDVDERKGSLDDLGLELSTNGDARFHALKRPTFTEEPKDQFVRFRRNGKTFILLPHYERTFMVLLATGMLVPPEPIVPIETRPFPQRNPTSYEFPGSVAEVKQKILTTFNDFEAMVGFYRTFRGESGFGFSVEDRENALFAKQYAPTIFADEKNKDDLYLHSFGTLIGRSPLYLGGGVPLRYGAEFQLHFTPMDPNKTRVSVITHNPRVYNGTICCGMHGYKSNTVAVEPTTIEEYKILQFIGRRLGVNDMPSLRWPEGSK